MAASTPVLEFLERILILILCLDFANGSWNTNDYMKREHSLVKPYQATGLGLSHWDFGGTTLLTNNFVRLTADRQSVYGSLWNTVPVLVHNWELQVHFKVHGSGKDLFGDGLAIWYARDRLVWGPVFGNQDYFWGLGIFIDTYSNHNGPHNHEHPYISAMVNNGSYHYDHDKDGTLTQLAGCSAKVRNLDVETYVSIRYLDDVLTVSTDISGKGTWSECFTIDGIQLPTGYFLGASAATGDLADNHDIISMKLYELESQLTATEAINYRQIFPRADKAEPARERRENDRNSSTWSGWRLFFILIVAIIGITVCVAVSYIVFQKQQETSRKRFY